MHIYSFRMSASFGFQVGDCSTRAVLLTDDSGASERTMRCGSAANAAAAMLWMLDAG